MKKTLIYLLAGLCFFLVILGFFNHLVYNKMINSEGRMWLIEKSSAGLQERKEFTSRLASVNPALETAASNVTWETGNNSAKWKRIADNGKEIFAAKEISALSKLDSTIICKAAKLGFKDLGLIGKLRRVVHKLEKEHPDRKAELLSLRRHEKDFLMRGDTKYLVNFHSEASAIKASGTFRKELDRYVSYFDSVAQVYSQLYTENGLLHQWEYKISAQQSLLRKYRSNVVISALSATRQARVFNILFYFVIFTATVLVVLWVFKRLRKQVKSIERAMSSYIASDYYSNPLENTVLPRNEFGRIAIHFLRVSQKITRDVLMMEKKILDRTESIRLQHEQLAIQHNEIRDSLMAAKELQRSLLPGETAFARAFTTSSLYYEPKNIVGGDFYWLHRQETTKCCQSVLALADCTGHGVPGALLTFLGMNALDELIRAGRRKPAGILNQLRRTVVRRIGLHANRAEGMDIGIVMIDDLKQTLTFSGANHSCWIIRDNHILELNGQRMPIGYTYFEVTSFENQEIKLMPGDKIMLFTDGLVDQFGGGNDKKFGRKRLRELMLKYCNEPLEELHLLLAYHFESWKGRQEQTDDCTFILVQPKFVKNRKASSSEGRNSINRELVIQ